MIDLKTEFLLENERVLLRPFSMDDFELFLPFSKYEPELWTYSLVSAQGSDNLKTYMEMAIKNRELNKSLPFLVFDKKTNAVAGSTRFYDYQPIHNTIQLGYTWYGKKYQGTGINKNCKFLMLELAFDKWELDRVEFRADYRNKRSIAAMKSIGCTEEGVLRSNCSSPVGRRDSIILSILEHEWKSVLKEKLAAGLG